jgi:hypothetical protein
MDLIKLSKDYPVAYKLMEKYFKCLYTAQVGADIDNSKGGLSAVTCWKITHPLKRDLYDFFDEQKIFIGITHSGEDVQFPIDWDITHGKQYDSHRVGYVVRSQAETDAFTKAFEILNKRLIKWNHTNKESEN